MHRKGESRGLSATWWQVQKSVRRRLCSGTTTLSARRRGAATRARHLNGLPEGGSWIAGAASATVTLPGASTAAIPAWGTWFSCEWGQNNAGVRVSQLERVKDKLRGFQVIHMVPDQRQEEGRGRAVSSERSPTRGNSSAACSKTSLESKREHVKIKKKNIYIFFSCCGSCVILTVLHIKSVGGQSQRGAAVLAFEAAAVEKLALRAEPLHHVHAFMAEKAHVAAADVGGELFSQGALWEKDWNMCFVYFIEKKQNKNKGGEERRGSSPYR